MPRIPIETAQGPRAFPQYASHIGAPQTVDIGDVAGATQQLGQQLAQDHFKAVAQQQALEFSKVKEETDAGIVGIKNELSVDERVLKNPQMYHPLFMERVHQLYRQINGTIVSGPGAKRAHDAYFTNRLPELAVEARQYGTNLIRADNLATLDNQLEVLSNKAAVTEGAQRAEAVNQATMLIDTAYMSGDLRGAGGLPDSRLREKMIRDFRAKTAEKRLGYLLKTDHHAIEREVASPEFVNVDPGVIARYLNLAVQKQETIDSKSDRLGRQVSEQMWHNYQTMAINKTLPASVLMDIENGTDAWVKDPTKAQVLRDLSYGAHKGDTEYSDIHVRAIMADVRRGISEDQDANLRNIRGGREALDRYTLESGGQVSISTAKATNALYEMERDIQRDKNALAAAGRAVRGAERAEDSFQAAQDARKRQELTNRKKAAYSQINELYPIRRSDPTASRNRQANFHDQIDNILDKNPDMTPEAAVKIIVDRQNTKKDTRSEAEKAADRVLDRMRR